MASWTDERVDRLKTLWLEGRSASAVARELGGVTRNAVIGKVHRLGLSGRAAPSAPTRLQRPTSSRPALAPSPSRRRPSPVRLAEPRSTEIAASAADGAAPRVPLLKLSACGCRFGIGDPRSQAFGFCDAPRVRGSYCARHAEIVYRPLPPAQARSDRKLIVHLRRSG